MRALASLKGPFRRQLMPQGHTDVVALLLDRGADLHYADDHVLYWAAVNGHLETVLLLLRRGATALTYILHASERHGHHAVADLLRAHLVD